MSEKFSDMLAFGGKSNSLGRVNEVIELVVNDSSLLKELYACMFLDDAWVRMRAADAFEKICRKHPDWLLPYVERFPKELAVSDQPSIQWHLAQIYAQVTLKTEQKTFAVNWLKQLLSSTNTDWIVAANAMDTLRVYVQDGSVSKADLLTIQQQHRSKSVVRRANKLLESLR